MATIQVRIDDELKKAAVEIYENLGMDLSTAIRVFLKRSVIERGVPFEMRNIFEIEEARKAIDNMTARSRELGNDKMSLNEINEIISDTRKKRHAKK